MGFETDLLKVCLDCVLEIERGIAEAPETVATITKSSVDSVRQGLVSYMSRPLSDFNKHEAMERF